MLSNLKYQNLYIQIYIQIALFICIFFSANSLHAGNTTLTWDPPTTNTDETLLTDLAGYKIHYGTESGNYTETIDIGNVSEYKVNNLTNGTTYYFVITAYDQSVPPNESGNSNQYSETISSNNQPSAHPGGPYSGIEGQSVTLDGSGSDDSDGSIDLYEWDINNDGTYDYSSASATQNHTYAQQGTYTIKLRVTDNLGATDSSTITADITDTSPTAGFTASPTEGTAPLQVNFADNSTGFYQPLTYEWDFDNNGTTDSTAQNPSYAYPDEGTYTVKLSITDLNGSSDTITRVNFIHVTTNNPPSAHPGGPYSGIEGQSIMLDGSDSTDSGGSIALYEWDINNDGTYDYSSTSSTQNHTYSQQGTYTIKLRVTDNLDETNDKTTTADISDSTPAVNFTGSPRNGISPLQVSFANNSSGYDQPLTYEWDFDNDGATDSTASNPSYSYSDEGAYTVKLTVTDSDGSTKIKTRNNYINVIPSTAGENILACYDGGNIECLERIDGGSESDNLDNGKPRLDSMEYNFKITVGDASGSAPQNIKLFMTQRSNPSSDDFYGYVMGCSGDYSTGATCSYKTKLGPAAVHAFFFEATMSDGTTLLRYPDAGYITGPDIELLKGYNLVGLPRDIIHESLDGISAFGSTSTYRWDADLEYYTKVTITEPVKPGEGYYVNKESDTLSVHEGYGDLPDAEFIYAIKPGWNIISNPYSGNLRLSEIKIGKGNNTPVAWSEATSNLWMTNAIYYNNGKDWGATYSFETDTEAMLVPWIGYWIYLNMEDDIYYFVIPQP